MKRITPTEVKNILLYEWIKRVPASHLGLVLAELRVLPLARPWPLAAQEVALVTITLLTHPSVALEVMITHQLLIHQK